MRDSLVNCLMDRGIEIVGVLKRDQAYVLLSTANMVFKDAASLVGPGVSLDSLGRSLDLEVVKGKSIKVIIQIDNNQIVL